MKLSSNRRQVIYKAVHDEIMDLRILLSKEPATGSKLDYLIAQAGSRAAYAALHAAEKPLRQTQEQST